MAFTVTTDLTDVDTAESATPWTTGALDPDKFVQGSNSIGWYASKNGRRVNGVSSKSISWSAGDHIYWWNASDVASKMEAQTTGTTTASGVTIRVTLANSAYREWHVAGSDTWDGGWRCFVVDLGHTGTHLYASSGSFVDTSNITDVDIYFDLTNSGNIRNVPANCYADAIRVGTGVTAYNTSAADAAFDLTDIADNDNLVANKRGVLEIKDGVLFAQGRVTVGDTGSNHVDFDSQNETFVFSLRDGTDGFGLVSDDLYEMNFVGNATGSDQDISFGVKVGTGDTATGRSGSTIQGTGTVRWKMDWNDADIHSFTMYGSIIRGAYDGTGVIGVQAGSPTTTHEVIGNTFDACGQIDTQDAVVRNVNILNSQETGTTFAALLWDETDIDIKNSLFVNNTNAIEVTTLTANMSFDGMEFSGNTTDVRYEGATDWDLNWTNATGAPSITNAGAGTLTAVNTVVLTLNDVATGSQCAIYAASGGPETVGTELMNEAAVSSTVTEDYAFTSNQPVEIRVRKSTAAPKYFPYNATGTITADGLTVSVSQVADTIAS